MSKKAFTLIELLSVIIILAIIIIIAIPNVLKVLNSSKTEVYNKQVRFLEQAAELYVSNKILNAEIIEPYITLQNLVDSKLIKEIPEDTRNDVTLNGVIKVTKVFDNYKYEYLEVNSNSGEVVLLDKNRELSRIIIEGNSEQVVTSTGKNLIDNDRILNGYNSYGGGVATTVVSISPTGFANVDSYILRVKPGTTYTLSVKSSGHSGRLFFYANHPVNKSGEISIGGDYYHSNKIITFTTTAETNWLFIVLTRDNINNPVGLVQLEEGNSATSYEPFIPNSPSLEYKSDIISAGNCNLIGVNQDGDTSIIDLVPVLHKIGNSYDTYNVVTGEYIKRIGVATANSGSWNDWSELGMKRAMIGCVNGKIGNNTKGLCNIAKVTNAQMGALNSVGEYTGNSIGYWYPDWNVFGLVGNETKAVADATLSNWLANNNLVLTYQFETPVTSNLGTNVIPSDIDYIYLDGQVKGNIIVEYQ